MTARGKPLPPPAPPGITDAQFADIVHDTLITTCIMLVVLVPMMFLERARRVDKKSVSYAMSACCSLAMTTAGFCNAVPELLGNGLDPLQLLRETRTDSFICTFFGAYCLLDLAIGSVIYPQYVDVLTGWIHHLAYFGLMWYLHHHHIQRGFALFIIEELPTFLLALGNVAKAWRTNVLFGGSFFATRLLWHGFLLVDFWQWRQEIHLNLYWPVGVTLALHLHWFSGYARQQLRKHQRSAKSKMD